MKHLRNDGVNSLSIDKMIMNLTREIMVNNSVKLAQFKLAQHRVQGTRSKLNIFEVAQLLDAIRTAEQMKSAPSNSIFHSISMN